MITVSAIEDQSGLLVVAHKMMRKVPCLLKLVNFVRQKHLDVTSLDKLASLLRIDPPAFSGSFLSRFSVARR